MHFLKLSVRTVLLALAFACVATDVPAAPVNINSADAQTLARELKGIGLKRAQAIVDYRVKHGPFKSADELTLVKGLGKQVVEKNRAEIRLDAVRSITKVQPAPVSAPAASAARKP
jgi:competence protein ComEA